MSPKNFKSILILILLFSFANGNAQEITTYPKNEFRAVWIATVANIDWPISNTDAVEKQKSDYIEILDTYKKLNYNALIVQIRSAGDAIYPTNSAPWSKYLTGKQGQAPTPYYDPLEWMITEAHNRGFEFHAWLNPYRATMDLNATALNQNHDLIKHPEWMIKYGEKYYYNPALPEVQQHLITVVEEVVSNYDVDAIHFDDYFYPYRIEGQNFNDTASFKKYGKGMTLADWRRNNVSDFVRATAIAIKTLKPWVQFGISPFGVWRNKSMDPKGSDTQSGQTNYDDLFADPMLWMQNRWIDYIIPQLYWSQKHKTASYSKLLKWWSENTLPSTALYIGNSTYKIKADSDKNWNNIYEFPNQIDETRSYKNVGGNAVFSAKYFVKNNAELTQILMEKQYKYPAIPNPVPNSKKEDLELPKACGITKNDGIYSLKLDLPVNKNMRYVVVYASDKNDYINLGDPSQIMDKIALQEQNDLFYVPLKNEFFDDNMNYAITYIDYFGNESGATLLDKKLLKKQSKK